jgi:thermitase
MLKLDYVYNGKPITFQAATRDEYAAAGAGPGPGGFESMGGQPAAQAYAAFSSAASLDVEVKDALGRVGVFNENATPLHVDSSEPNVVTIPTATVIVSGTAAQVAAEAERLRKKFGLKKVEEGVTGTVLLRAPSDGAVGIQEAFNAVSDAAANGKASVQPNFLRARDHRRIDGSMGPAAAGAPELPWNYKLIGVAEAWKITKGIPAIRVAILDEGTDTLHPDLKAAIVAERDFIGTQAHARPERNDSHGTACAGIVGSRSAAYPGIAPNVSLVAARIARSNPIPPHRWIFDDFKTQDAIDWCWQVAKADVLSNSWGGGLPSDAIRLAFERARTKGRGGKGCVVVIAAGNAESTIPFPATLPNMLVVGASNQQDQRKTKATFSVDGENWWGSNFGPTMSLVAPGVGIKTTDMRGAAGYSAGDYVDTFNGTSSATPHVAAAAALILSLQKGLREDEVRKIITSTAKALPDTKPNVGSGRLNLLKAVQKAQPGGGAPKKKTAKAAKAAPKKAAKKAKHAPAAAVAAKKAKPGKKKPALKKAAKKKPVKKAPAKKTPKKK